jgi:hypothetical protein
MSRNKAEKQIHGFKLSDVVNRRIKKAYLSGNKAKLYWHIESRVWRHRIYLQLEWLKKVLGMIISNP